MELRLKVRIDFNLYKEGSRVEEAQVQLWRIESLSLLQSKSKSEKVQKRLHDLYF